MIATRKSLLAPFLKALEDPEVYKALSEAKVDSRLLDEMQTLHGDKFNWMLVNWDTDLQSLTALLNRIKHVATIDNHPQLTDEVEIKAIQDWVKTIIYHTCKDFLARAAGVIVVRSEIRSKLNKTPEELPADEFVCAYIAIIVRDLFIAVSHSPAFKNIDKDVFVACSVLANNYDEWLNVMLYGKEKPKAQSTMSPYAAVLGAGAFLFAGVLTAAAIAIYNTVNAPEQKPEPSNYKKSERKK
jgi:hypothetical protein